MTLPGRLGTYYLEPAVPPRPGSVIYDRAGSCAASLGPADVDWDHLLDARVLHLTGITPALSPSCGALVVAAAEEARRRGVTVSLDLNYRARLWSPAEAAVALERLLPSVDILFCARRDAEALFGFRGDPSEVLACLQRVTPARWIVLTLAQEGAAALADGLYLQRPALPTTIVDRIGAGDALAAGVLDGYLDGSPEGALERGTALAAMALAQHGDALVTDRGELEAVLSGAGTGVVR
jgi:2-dehydro-3-deoxygluconokinase